MRGTNAYVIVWFLMLLLRNGAKKDAALRKTKPGLHFKAGHMVFQCAMGLCLVRKFFSVWRTATN